MCRSKWFTAQMVSLSIVPANQTESKKCTSSKCSFSSQLKGSSIHKSSKTGYSTNQIEFIMLFTAIVTSSRNIQLIKSSLPRATASGILLIQQSVMIEWTFSIVSLPPSIECEHPFITTAPSATRTELPIEFGSQTSHGLLGIMIRKEQSLMLTKIRSTRMTSNTAKCKTSIYVLPSKFSSVSSLGTFTNTFYIKVRINSLSILEELTSKQKKDKSETLSTANITSTFANSCSNIRLTKDSL